MIFILPTSAYLPVISDLYTHHGSIKYCLYRCLLTCLLYCLYRRVSKSLLYWLYRLPPPVFNIGCIYTTLYTCNTGSMDASLPAYNKCCTGGSVSAYNTGPIDVPLPWYSIRCLDASLSVYDIDSLFLYSPYRRVSVIQAI